MGSDDPEDRFVLEASPKHLLFLPKYFMARWPVTVAQYRTFVEQSSYPNYDPEALDGADNHPVVYVAWNDALAYCLWLNEQLQVWARQRFALRSRDARDQDRTIGQDRGCHAGDGAVLQRLTDRTLGKQIRDITPR